MKVTLCGSLSFREKILAVKTVLVQQGHEVLLPHSIEVGFNKESWQDLKNDGEEKFYSLKSNRIKKHFDKIEISDAVIIINEEKSGVQGYIGGNTLMEMAIAFYLHKKIYILNAVPESPYREEILGMQPIILNGSLSLI